MRGYFGRNRVEKPPPGLIISSYEEALYPPRAFRFHIQHQTFPQRRQQQQQQTGSQRGTAAAPPLPLPPPVVVLPSIDADTICEPYVRTTQMGAFAGGGAAASSSAPVSEKKPPPALREFLGCYVPGIITTPAPVAETSSHLADVTGDADGLEGFSTLLRYAQFAGRAAGWIEPMNILHYPHLLVAPTSSSLSPSATKLEHGDGVNPGPRHDGGIQETVTALADALGIPQELRTFADPVSNAATGALKRSAKAEARLRIRAAPRQKPARVLRRGAKVAIIAPAQPAPGFHGHHSQQALQARGKRPRSGPSVAALEFLAAEDDEDGLHSGHKRFKTEDDIGGFASGAGRGEGGDRPHSAGGTATKHNTDDWEDYDGADADADDDDELSVDLYDAADDDDQAAVDDIGSDDDGKDYF